MNHNIYIYIYMLNAILIHVRVFFVPLGHRRAQQTTRFHVRTAQPSVLPLVPPGQFSAEAIIPDRILSTYAHNIHHQLKPAKISRIISCCKGYDAVHEHVLSKLYKSNNNTVKKRDHKAKRALCVQFDYVCG